MPKMPSREGKGESAEALPPSECDVRPRRSLTEGKRSPEALPPEGERGCSMALQGNPNEGEHEASWPPQELLCKDDCPFGRDQALAIQEGGRQGSTSSIRKGLLRPRTKTTYQALTPATKAGETARRIS